MKVPLFLSTLSLRRATRAAVLAESRPKISIHALLAESDPAGPGSAGSSKEFLSTLSLRRATAILEDYDTSTTFLSTLSLRRATATAGKGGWTNEFLSTLSLRRATAAASIGGHPHENFYPRSPCGERLVDIQKNMVKVLISIHALLAESDIVQIAKNYTELNFYPRSPCGERRPAAAPNPQRSRNFYPRSPCGERPSLDCNRVYKDYISIHALLAESEQWL